MPKIYQAWYKTPNGTRQKSDTSETRLLKEAKELASLIGKEIYVDTLSFDTLTNKLLCAFVNGAKPERERICSFAPYGKSETVVVNGTPRKKWNVRKKK